MVDYLNDANVKLSGMITKSDKTSGIIKTDFKWQNCFVSDFFNKIKKTDSNNQSQSDYDKKKQVVMNIINNDAAAPKDLDKEKMSDMILSAASETGIDPIVLSCIAKQESHFNQNVGISNGSGIMQLTTIVAQDMFLRPQVYDKNLKPLMRKYGSIEKILEAKKKDPSIDLGSFGKILEKYKNPKGLMSAIRKDSALNIKLGAYLFKAKLAQARGDEKKALVLYNGSKIKDKYANEVIASITDVRLNNKCDKGFGCVV